MSKLDSYTRRLLGAAPLYENWLDEGIDKAPESAYVPGVARPRSISPGLLGESVSELQTPDKPRKGSLKERLSGIIGKKIEESVEDVAETPKVVSVMEEMKKRMGLEEAKMCRCGCGGKGSCGAAKSVNSRMKKMKEDLDAKKVAAKKAHEEYDPEMREARRLAGIESAHVDAVPPVTRIPVLGLGIGKAMW